MYPTEKEGRSHSSPDRPCHAVVDGLHLVRQRYVGVGLFFSHSCCCQLPSSGRRSESGGAFAQGEKKSAEKDRFGWVAVRRARVVGWLDRMNPALVRAFVGLVGIALYFFVALMSIFSISHGNPLKMAAHVVAGLFGLALAAVVFVILRRAVKWTGARNIALPFYLYLISYALLVPSFVFPGSTSDCFGMAWVAVVLCSAVVAVFRLCLSKKSSKKDEACRSGVCCRQSDTYRGFCGRTGCIRHVDAGTYRAYR